jgi:hypothetical protein
MNEIVDTVDSISRSFVDSIVADCIICEDPEDWAQLQPEYMLGLAQGQLVALRAAIASKQGTVEIRQHAIMAAAELMRLAYIYGDL